MTNKANSIIAILVSNNVIFEYKPETFDILECIIDEHNHTIDDEDTDSLIEALDVIEAGLGGDFTLEFDGNDYRVICNDCIWEIYIDEIQQIVEDCYELKLDKLPEFIAVKIDWEETAQNAYADGYGHTFSGYDHSEHEAGNHWIFRTN